MSPLFWLQLWMELSSRKKILEENDRRSCITRKKIPRTSMKYLLHKYFNNILQLVYLLKNWTQEWGAKIIRIIFKILTKVFTLQEEEKKKQNQIPAFGKTLHLYFLYFGLSDHPGWDNAASDFFLRVLQHSAQFHVMLWNYFLLSWSWNFSILYT